MADHGTIALISADPTLADLGEHSVILEGLSQPAISQIPDAYTLPRLSSGYLIAGTVTPPPPYTPPTQGQLWPRGDLDAI